MRRLIVIVLTAVLLFTSCVRKDYDIYEPLPENYTLEMAKNDGYVVHEDGHLVSGKGAFEEFVKRVEKGESAVVRLAFYYTLDREGVSKEYYEQNKGRYPVLYIKELRYDGDIYTLRYTEQGKELRKRFLYMKHLPFYPKNVEADYEYTDHYVLLNDDNVESYGEIWRSLVSSVFGEYIEHETVFSEYIRKE